jgi:hypothetical protein
MDTATFTSISMPVGPSPTLTLTPLPPTFTATSTSSLSTTPTTSATATPIPPSPTITSTLEPTLTFAQSQHYLFELLQHNAGCKLPCWWGITPGVTTWDEANRLIVHMGFVMKGHPIDNGYTYYGLRFDWAEPFTVNSLGFYVGNGVVEGIGVSGAPNEDVNFFRTLWRSFSPERVIPAYGPPTRVWVSVFWYGVPYDVSARLVVFYDQLKFLVVYHTRALTVDDPDQPVFRICPSWGDLAWYPSLDMYILSPDNPMSLEEYVARLSSLPLAPPDPSLEEVAGISTEEFYKRFLPGNGPACIDTPQDLWK